MILDESNPMIGTRHVCQCCGRVATITEFDRGGHGSDDPPGYAYVFDGEPGVRWISVSGAAVRFVKLEARP